MRILLTVTVSFFFCCTCFAQTTDRDILLKGVDDIVLPDSPATVYAIINSNDQTQIIAVGVVQQQQWTLPAIISSRLGRGKLLIFGSDLYLKGPLLARPTIRRLMDNSLSWAKDNGLPGRKGVQYCDHDSLVIAPSTGVVVLTRDIKDPAERSGLETFIRKGGTLIFGCASGDGSLNDLFNKAGLYPVYMPLGSVDNTRRLGIDVIPPYLHIRTTLEAIKAPGFTVPASDADMYASTLANYIFHNDDTAATYREILRAFDTLDHGPMIPMPGNAVIKADTKNYLAYEVQGYLANRKQHGHPDPGFVDPSSRTFPGAVDAAAKRVDETITIPVQGGRQGLAEQPSVFYRWHSTGLYVPAGEKVSIYVDTSYVPRRLKARIGVHDDNLQHMDYFTRNEADLTRTFELGGRRIEIYSPFGGLLMIDVPDTSTLKNMVVRVSGAVRTPWFRLGLTSVRDWQQSIRNFPGPWAELASDKIILTVPSYRIRRLDDPEKLLRFWDEVMDADAKLASIPLARVQPERIIIDRQVAFGYMFTAPQKIVAPDDESCALMLDEALIRTKGSWGHFHELGHRHQFFEIDFTGLGEVTANLYTMYVYDKVLHKGIYNHENIPNKAAVIANIKKYMAGGPSFEKFCNDPFLALSMYIELIENFGWQSIGQVLARYRKLPREQYPATDADKRDYWFVCISEVTGKNLAAFFDKWKVPVTDKAKASVKGKLRAAGYELREWLPEELK